MKIIRCRNAQTYEPEKDWKRMSVCDEKEISIEQFTKPAKHSSPRHQHPNAQVVVVTRGKLLVITDADGVQELNEGDCVYLSGNEPHIFTNPLDIPSEGLDIFLPGRSFDFWRNQKKSS